MKFDELVSIIKETDNVLKQRALVAVNITVTIRNWLTGFYIVEFEQNGEDRAKYGERLLTTIAQKCKEIQLKSFSYSNLKYYRQFYLVYPAIGQSVLAFFTNNSFTIRQSLIGELLNAENQNVKIRQSLTGDFNYKNKTKIKKVQSPTALSDFSIWQSLSTKLQDINSQYVSKTETSENYGVESEILINRLSYTHLIELIKIDEPLKRAFYEIECIKGNWSVRELQRQMGSLLFERTGLSTNKEKMLEIANKKSTQFLPDDIIRDPYIFEFLGLKQSEVVPESTLEDMLIIHLQDFLLELGKGFCFEARQKRITIDNKHYYIDLVFYHKILKCNVIIELKMRDFEHADASQLKVYLNYWKKHEMLPNDNPPVGILLCTGKNEELVEFAIAGDENLFISKYLIELPSVNELKAFIHKMKTNI